MSSSNVERIVLRSALEGRSGGGRRASFPRQEVVMTGTSRIVVVGGGLAAATAVTELRERGFDGAVTVVGAEPRAPYERPPLSKGVLIGDEEPDTALVHPAGWYAEHDVELLLGEPATRIDRAA